MGVWFLAMANANKFAGVLSSLYPEKDAPKQILGFQIIDMYDFFMVFVFMAGGAAIILFFLSKLLMKMMHGIR